MKSYPLFTILVVSIITAVTCSFAFSQPIKVTGTVRNIGPAINTPGDDFSPSFTADGKVMVFNSKRRGERYQNLYISYYSNGAWSEAQPLNELNSPYNDETPFITPDGGYIFFSSDRDGSIEMQAEPTGQIRVSYDLYVSRHNGSQWERPIRLPGTINTAHHERSPSLSADLMTLYYTTWPFGDITRAYIMKAEYSDGEFIHPQALPAPINTNSQDLGLMPSPDGKGFYFSSLRDGGYGGWDIYYVPFINGKYGPAVNMGPQINSKYNELHLTIIDTQVFFSSNRPGGSGLYDIYTAQIAAEESGLKIVVRDKKTKKPLSVEMNVSTKIKESDEKTVTYEIKKKTDDTGEAVVQLAPEAKDADVTILHRQYFPVMEKIEIEKHLNTPYIIELVPIEKEARIDIHAIYFDFESSVIRTESFPYLATLAEYLKKNPSLRFEITGHTDLHGNDEFNTRLSLERAQAVKDYLVQKGLNETRFTVRGAGKSEPKVPKMGPGYDEQNRRTEFKLIDN